jgi:hypothetical protein
LTALRRMLEDKTPTLMSRLIGGGTWQADKACTHTPTTGRRYCQVAEISSITNTKEILNVCVIFDLTSLGMVNKRYEHIIVSFSLIFPVQCAQIK